MWSIIGGIVLVAWLIGTIKEHFKKKNEKESSREDGEFVGELPPIPKETMLDYDLHKVLSAEWLPSAMGTARKPITREYIRSMIVGEILLRVKPEAINPEALEFQGSYGLEKARKTFDDEVAALRKQVQERRTRIESVREIMAEHGISEEWILGNGALNPSPLNSPSTHAATIASMERLLATGNYSLKDFELYGQDFGNQLVAPSVEEISDRELDLLIKYKDRLVKRYLETPGIVAPPQLSEPPHPDEKYRPKQ